MTEMACPCEPTGKGGCVDEDMAIVLLLLVLSGGDVERDVPGVMPSYFDAFFPLRA